MRRVGVDIGGTFTDLVAYDEDTGETFRTKARTVPTAPEEGLMQACDQAVVDPHNISYFMHATTLVTNLILTRDGAKIALITTKGFRDVILIGRAQRKELFNLQWEKPRAFVPRHLIQELNERIDHHGNVLTPLDKDEARLTIRALARDGVESVAVALFNSYANPLHERLIAEIAKEEAPRLYVSLSVDVDPRIREYERFSTTVLNAYAMPKTRGYIERLEGALGIAVKYMHSGGGVMPSEEAGKLPIGLVASGPAAGVLAAKFIGARVHVSNLITMDVGGTSCDICVLRDGKPEVKDQVEVAWGIPARTQAIDVNSIGAGGGSIAWVDEGGALRVGPQSAGADPGPACYDMGGTMATVTDANLVLGMLNADNFLGGRFHLSIEKARVAIRPIADHFHVSIENAARGTYKILIANVAQAILQATVKKGIDPRGFTLVPFGGAGGQIAIAVAHEVGIKDVLLPPHPSAFSAFGLLTADLKSTASKTILLPLERFAVDDLTPHLRELEAFAGRFLEHERSIIETQLEHILDIRYIGQSTEVPVSITLSTSLDREQIYKRFEDAHNSLYGTMLGDPAEIVNIRVTATGTVAPLQLAERERRSASRAKPKTFRRVALIDHPIPIYDRTDLRYGMTVDHPCIIEEVDSTFYVPEDCTAAPDGFGNIIFTLGITDQMRRLPRTRTPRAINAMRRV